MANKKIKEVVQIYSNNGTIPLDFYRKGFGGAHDGKIGDGEQGDMGTFTKSLENITLFILNRQQTEASEAANYLTEAMMEDKDEEAGDGEQEKNSKIGIDI